MFDNLKRDDLFVGPHVTINVRHVGGGWIVMSYRKNVEIAVQEQTVSPGEFKNICETHKAKRVEA